VAESASEAADANQALRHGLKRISKICDVLSEKFEDRLAEFQKSKAKEKK